ncbi:MAG: hypothetical protein WBO36_04775 [Saprospiraceae bacterium]
MIIKSRNSTQREGNKPTPFHTISFLSLVGRFLSVIWLSLVWSSCGEDSAPDVSNIPADVKIIRTEQLLFDIATKKDFYNLFDMHPSFYNLYFSDVLALDGAQNRDSLYVSFDQWVKDSLVTDLFSKVNTTYKETISLKTDADQMYRYLQHYFPRRYPIPNLYTFVSEYNYQVFIFEDEGKRDGIGIGLDMFLQKDIDYKLIDPDNTNFSDYITRSWNKDHIIKKVAELYVNDLVGEMPGRRMIDQMIHHGKVHYITDLILPAVHDSIIMEFTGTQLQWCQDNETQIWAFFFEKNLFFESNPTIIGKYVNLSPSSPEMPAEAPGRTANFVGWQIIKEYMKRYPETTLQQLIELKDSQLIMEKSKYKPKQN